LEKDLATEDYYRALNEYKRIHTMKEEKKIIDHDKAYSVILNDSPDKVNFPAKDKENLIVLPRETVYMIDKVVRQRTSRARLLVKDELLENPHNEEECKSPEDHYKNVKKISRSMNYESLDQDYSRGTSNKKHRSGDHSLSTRSVRRAITFEEWYRYAFIVSF
jgi:hypothetical protein